MQKLVITLSEGQVSALIVVGYVLLAFIGGFFGRRSRPGIPDRNAGALRLFGALFAVCLVGVVHAYPSFWAIIPAGLVVFATFGLRADY
jgi:hypothetical protein